MSVKRKVIVPDGRSRIAGFDGGIQPPECQALEGGPAQARLARKSETRPIFTHYGIDTLAM
jgi:hypothetical protein